MEMIKVLMVDSGPSQARLKINILKQFSSDYQFFSAFSLIDTVDVLEKESIDVMIVDIRMPNMDGIELIRRMAEISPMTEVVILTAYNDNIDVLEGLRLGINYYLIKPFEDESLHICVMNSWKKKKNIEERKQVERELIKEKERAESASFAKSAFLANMSHELRTPLNAILGYAQILCRDTELDQSLKSAADVINRCGEHLLMLINDILDISRIEAEKTELKPEEFSFSAFMKFIEEIFQISAKRKNINFQYVTEGVMPEIVYGDKTRLRQILMNLLGNAVKFTEQGKVQLKVRRIPDPENTDSATISFEVSDTGIGIPHDRIPDIFKPFQQIQTVRIQNEGTGLGLAIADKLIRLMGGSIQVESRLNSGSLFKFQILMPVVREMSIENLDNIRNISGYEGKSKRILIVEDIYDNRMLLNNLLIQAGFEVENAENGRIGLEKILNNPPDAVLTDMIMPEMDGYEMIRHVRKKPEFKDLIIIGVSADVANYAKIRSSDAGCTDFISKPIVIDELFKMLSKHLHLEWIYEKMQVPEETNGKFSNPSEKDLAELDYMAKVGNIRGIKKKLIEIKNRSPEFSNFCSKVEKMAQSFDMNEIRHYIGSL